MILTVTVNPSVDHALFVEQIKLGDTNRVQRTERDAGGKGVNLARVVAELGSEALATGFLGGGPGAYVRKVLDRQGVRHSFIEVEGETRTNFSVENAAKDPPTTFNEKGPEISGGEMEELFAHVRELLPKVRWLAVGGSLPPGVPPDVFKTLGQMAQDAGCRWALDADGEPLKLGLEAKPHFVKPNHKEAARLLGRPVDSLEAAVAAAREVWDRIRDGFEAPHPVVVISRGEDGAVMACAEGVFNAVGPKVEVRSTIGSGDSMIAGMLWALEKGKPLEEAFRWGTACGGATATTTGSEIARKPVILALLPQVQVERIG